jgi:hypothetical protein
MERNRCAVPLVLAIAAMAGVPFATAVEPPAPGNQPRAEAAALDSGGSGSGAGAAATTTPLLPGLNGGVGAMGGVPVVTDVFPTCVKAGDNWVVSATITPITAWASVRVYFRRAGTQDFYYLEMRTAGNGQYWSVLPKPDPGKDAVEGYIVVTDGEGHQTRTPLRTVPCVSNCTVHLTPEQLNYSQNLVVGETVVGQHGKQVFKFMCDGIISRIDTIGQLSQDAVCRQIIAALAQPHKILLPLGAILVGGGAVAVIRHHEPPPASPTGPTTQ